MRNKKNPKVASMSFTLALYIISAGCSTSAPEFQERASVPFTQTCVDNRGISHACHHSEESPTKVTAAGCVSGDIAPVLKRDHTLYEIALGTTSLNCLKQKTYLPITVGGAGSGVSASSKALRVGTVQFDPPKEIMTWIADNTVMMNGRRVLKSSGKDTKIPEWVFYLRSSDPSMGLSVMGQDGTQVERECIEPINATQCPGLTQANRYLVPATAGTLTLKFVTREEKVAIIFERDGHDHVQ